MLVLGLESSCDETSAALYQDQLVLANVVRSQIDIHKHYGGVVPEIASRAHLEAMDSIVTECFQQAGCQMANLDGLAVTQGPGLVGALLVALSFAKGLALAADLPLTGVNHVKAHALAPFMKRNADDAIIEPHFPLVALVVSGGHTNLYLVKDFLAFQQLGRTRDDAAGEAFDKTAKLMGLGYPGGRIIEQMAKAGDPAAYNMPRPMLKEGLDFSFSGLKTHVLNIYQKENFAALSSDDQKLKDLAASFQAAVVEVLSFKLLSACKMTGAQEAVLAGGVAANGTLRAVAKKLLAAHGIKLYVPPLEFCVDNGAMIAHLGARQLAAGDNLITLSAEAYPRWSVA